MTVILVKQAGYSCSWSADILIQKECIQVKKKIREKQEN